MKQKSDFENSASNVISFKKYKENDSRTVSSTIAAILAIKIDHPHNITPEDFFINQIDSYDNIELLAFEDALDNNSLGLTTKDAQNEASNDD
ncbi:hypothetical protein OAR00_01160 [Alphaproteobacteria bacterium]|nr:hypothetical protein [Alphaproteobacteria bacterium]MDC1023142.1 hypothetical protein [Alphaproteobacteria bacterium]